MTESEPKILSGYEILGNIGLGAGSRIYKARNKAGEFFAIKRVIRKGPLDDRYVQQVDAEWTAAKKVNDPRIRKVIALKKLRSFTLALREVHLIMEFFDGRNLQQFPPKSVGDVIHVFREVAGGLWAMHRAGLLHADIKPQNILVDDGGLVKVIDLGQSSPLGKAKDRIQGTPDFIAPEQVHRDVLDERTDIFNLGASFYWIITGENIPTSLAKETSAVPLVGRARKAIGSLSDARSDVPPGLSKLVMDCCKVNPAQRPRNMGEVINRLDMVESVTRRRGGAGESHFSHACSVSDDDAESSRAAPVASHKDAMLLGNLPASSSADIPVLKEKVETGPPSPARTPPADARQPPAPAANPSAKPGDSDLFQIGHGSDPYAS